MDSGVVCLPKAWAKVLISSISSKGISMAPLMKRRPLLNLSEKFLIGESRLLITSLSTRAVSIAHKSLSSVIPSRILMLEEKYRLVLDCFELSPRTRDLRLAAFF
jgi:hypothetical protein